jgi:MFS family permease
MTLLAFGANWAGSFLFNVLGDKYGRLLISKIGFLLACSLYLFYLPPLYYPLVLVYMLLFGFFNSYFLQSYILGVEFTSTENRDFYTVIAQAFDSLMQCVTVFIFTFTKNFRVFMISGFGIGVVISVCMFIFVVESPRYYVALNKHKKAVEVYKYLAKMHPDQMVKKKIEILEQRVNAGLEL